MACRKTLYYFFTITFFYFLLPGIAQADEALNALKALSLDALTDVEITIAGKTPQKVGDIPAAVYVVSQEDIQRMGATSIPEVLRMVPGLQVAKIDANKWAITSRGFNSLFASKLLVMIDGRSVYSPLFSGVEWDIQDVVLEDIERIEVIRGPGATVWGANAVNGVINIITSNAKDTQGTLLATTIGTEQGIVTARHGDKLSEDAYYRVYAKYRDQDDGELLDGQQGTDGWHDVKTGFRMDWQADPENNLTIQGDLYQGTMGNRVTMFSRTSPFQRISDQTTDVWGGNILGRWNQSLSNGASQELQAYYDYNYRDSWVADSEQATLDLDYQHHFAPSQSNDIIAGLGYRFHHDDIVRADLTEVRTLLRSYSRQTHLFSAFIQDDITLIDQTLWLTLGSKFEHNDYSGFEFQPNARLRWKPKDGHLLWTAVSRAVRTPSRGEQDASLIIDSPVAPGVNLGIIGNSEFDSEDLIAYEIGYRLQLQKSFTFDLALYYHDYDNLLSFESSGISLPAETAPVAVFGVTADNKLFGETYGAEVAINWQPTDNWNLRGAYTYTDEQFYPRPDSSDRFHENNKIQKSEHFASLLSSYQMTPNLAFNLFGRYVDEAAKVASYVDLDAGIIWQAHKDVALSVYGRNLFHDVRFEFQQNVVAPISSQVEREVYLKIDWRF